MFLQCILSLVTFIGHTGFSSLVNPFNITKLYLYVNY